MNRFRRLAALGLACACLCGTALSEESQTSADNFTPSQTAEVGSHGEVDQSLLLDQPTVEPLETFDINEAVEDSALLEGGIDYDGTSESAGSSHGSDEEASVEGIEPSDDSGIRFDNEEEPNQIAGLADGIVVPTNMPVVDVGSVRFSALTDASLGFTFNYPAEWENIPGIYTICFRERVEKDDIPCRYAVSVKKMVHTVQEDKLTEQLTRYMRIIAKQYADNSFQPGKVNLNDSFMGRPAFSNTYLAYYGEQEVEGFIIGTAIGKIIVVGHFNAAYDDYQSMYNVMRYMINSTQLLTQEQN